MRTNSKFKKELPILVIVLLPILFAVIAYNKMANVIEVNWFNSKQIPIWSFLSLVVGINIFVYGLFLLAVRIDPKRKNYEVFESSFYKIRFITSLFIAVISGLTVTSHLGIMLDELKIVSISTFVIFAIIGNYINSIKPNWFIGFRTPWTIDNETVWRKTHQFGSKIMVAFSILGLILSLIPQKQEIRLLILFGIILTMVIIPIIYSYKVHKRLEVK